MLLLLLTALWLGGLAGCAGQPSGPAVVHAPVEQVPAVIARLPAGTHISSSPPTVQTLQAVAKAGYVGVIDLRLPSEPRSFDEAEAADRLGLRYVSLPISDPRDMTYANAALLKRAMRKLDGPLLMHCASGNRVGALIAIQASAEGASDEDAIALGKAAGLTRSENVVRQVLKEGQ